MPEIDIHADLMRLLSEEHEPKANNPDRLFFINNMRQRFRLPRLTCIDEAETWMISVNTERARIYNKQDKTND